MQFIFTAGVGDWIDVTLQYSNAVLVAAMPLVENFAKKLDLPLPIPIKAEHIQRTLVFPYDQRVAINVHFTNGVVIGVEEGHANAFIGTNMFWSLQDPSEIPRFYGPVNMTTNEVIAFARNLVTKAGYSLEDTFTVYPPRIEQAHGIGTNIVPHFRLVWSKPGIDEPVIDIEINANRKAPEAIHFRSIKALYRPMTIAARPGKLPPEHPWQKLNEIGAVNPEYARRLVPHVFSAVEDWIQRFDVPLPVPVTTNQVATFLTKDDGGWPRATVTYTNHWMFTYRCRTLTRFGSPRRFFDSNWIPFHTKNYIGEWKLNEAQAVEVAKRFVSRLGHPPGFVRMEGNPRVTRPVERPGWPTIPRLLLEWHYPSVQQCDQWVRVEVDCDRGTVEEFGFDDQSFWGQGPPIDVPIARKAASAEK